MPDNTTPHTSPFDAIRKIDEHGNEYWSARELYKILGYSRWEKFRDTIERAKIACEEVGQAASDHFHLEVQLIATGKGAKRKAEDIHLSRYACYLTLLNADPSGKPQVALAQTYFAVQTRRQELADQLKRTDERLQNILYDHTKCLRRGNALNASNNCHSSVRTRNDLLSRTKIVCQILSKPVKRTNKGLQTILYDHTKWLHWGAVASEKQRMCFFLDTPHIW